MKSRALRFGRAAPNPGAREGEEAELRRCRESVVVAEDALSCLPVSSELEPQHSNPSQHIPLAPKQAQGALVHIISMAPIPTRACFSESHLRLLL